MIPPMESELFDDAWFIRNNLFFFPKKAFLEKRAEATKHCMYFLESDITAFFTNRFLSTFLTDINMKNKRTQHVETRQLSPAGFKNLDHLSSAGLCNQLIEDFVLGYCKTHNIKAKGHIYNLTDDYNNELAQHQTNCFAPFRRSTKIFYVDELVARQCLIPKLQDAVAKESRAQPASLWPQILLYEKLETTLGFRRSRTVAHLVRQYEKINPRPTTTHIPEDTTLRAVRWTTVGQLNYFKWFITNGGMALLLRHRTQAVAHLELKRRQSMENKRTRRVSGVTKRQRKVAKRIRQCKSSAVLVGIDQTITPAAAEDGEGDLYEDDDLVLPAAKRRKVK